MESVTTALYIGAGTDMAPVGLFPNIKNFVYIDSQPQSPYGTLDYDSGRFYNEDFIGAVIDVAKEEGLILKKISGSYLEFAGAPGRTLRYFINTSFPEHLGPDHRIAIAECDVLILAGYCPDRAVLELAPRLETVLDTLHTAYVLDYEDEAARERAVFDYLIQNPTRIKNYILYDEMTAEYVYCKRGLAEFEATRLEAPYYKMKNGISALL